MSVAKIKLNAVSEVKDFVNEANKCDYDVDVSYNRVVIDGKSLVGVMSIDLTHTLTVTYHEDDHHFTKVIAKYAV
ncbi:MAG: HPr family phosphocarrier protein [Lachnospiraceae bacterium]|nr:HPr family phosphocarrier protein [Lachnospiraceae bacterium]